MKDKLTFEILSTHNLWEIESFLIALTTFGFYYTIICLYINICIDSVFVD